MKFKTPPLLSVIGERSVLAISAPARATLLFNDAVIGKDTNWDFVTLGPQHVAPTSSFVFTLTSLNGPPLSLRSLKCLAASATRS